MLEGLIIIGAGLVAGAVSWTLARGRSRQAIAAAEAEATQHIENARKMADLARREAESRVRDAVAQIEQTSATKLEKIHGEMTLLTELLEKKQARVQAREGQIQTRASAIDDRFAEVNRAKKECRDIRSKAKEARRSCKRTLEQQAGLTAQEIAEVIVERMVEETRSSCADRLRNLESTGAEEFGRQAKRVMGIVMQRYTGHCVRERTAMTMALEGGVAERLQRPNALKYTARLSELTAVNLSFADDGSSVRLDSGDGVARELCRRCLARIAKEDEIHNIDGLIESIKSELDREILKTGRKAFRELKLDDAGQEIIELVGRLNFRTSYTQNQWRHAIEAAYIAAMIASELGLAPDIAKRGALLHDIGKALTHEIEGSHALIGAEIARKNNEAEEVANAIGYHHGEEPAISAYAPLVAAADAMSGGRPGARREMVESYGDRIGDLEKIAGDFPGVTQVHAVQAGRELRVHVDEKHVVDADLQKLSTAIASRISDEMTFPGQIRVTVIREFCAVDFAS